MGVGEGMGMGMGMGGRRMSSRENRVRSSALEYGVCTDYTHLAALRGVFV